MVPGEVTTVDDSSVALKEVPPPVTQDQKNSKRRTGKDVDGDTVQDVQPVKRKKARTEMKV
jgi:hypothetical protein